MKKVGILTFNDAINYGALCQMYALYTTLSKYDFDVQIINYDDPVISNRYKLFSNRKSIKSNIKEMLFVPVRLKEKKAFESFKFRMNMSPKVNNTTISKLMYDVVVAGSDQIWNVTLTNSNDTYFLKWFDGYKYSYAASFGVNEFDNRFESILHHLNKYNSISVREQNAVKYLKGFGIEAECHIDPVLLLSQIDWMKIAKLPNEKQEYILIYTIGYSEKIIDFAKKLSAEKNLNIIYLSDDVLSKPGMKIVRGASPEEWIGYFYYAKYVITNSFHGTAFSILFNKEFFCDYVKTNLKNTNTRIENMLDIMGIKNRNFCGERIDNINWEEVNKVIEYERARSAKYLSNL